MHSRDRVQRVADVPGNGGLEKGKKKIGRKRKTKRKMQE
jgi:hypothetical protein